MIVNAQHNGNCCKYEQSTITTTALHGARPVLRSTKPPATPDREQDQAVDTARIERAVREILYAIGEDPDREGLAETPRRVAKAYAQIFSGLHQDPAVHLGRVFREQSEEVVLCRDIEFHSMCEHHLLPFFGRAHVAYVPDGSQVVGLSKLARTVEVFARRPQVQERLTNQIADALDARLAPRGVLVMIESEHLCMKMRGVNKSHPSMVTVAVRGCLRSDPGQRAEVMSMIAAAKKGM